ncbi:MAG: M15 family metallopeptidase [Rickettsiales bacterium]
MKRKPWEEFTGKTSQTFVRELIPSAITITQDQLVDMKIHESPALNVCVAYAQEELIYDDRNRTIRVDKETYAKASRHQRINKFGLAYPKNYKLYLHKTLAEIVISAADYLYKTYGWQTILYDGLRTVDGAFRIYNLASDEDLASGILAMPAESAHNKAMAIDSMMIDSDGREIDMGGHFDHLDMSTNMRYYNGNKISETAKRNRIIREAAFLRAAFGNGLLIAPLRNEFWDDRLPENREDLWRVLDSAARCVGLEYTAKNKENWIYTYFLENWRKIFTGHEEKLLEIIGHTTPPLEEKIEFYHGNYNPIYDEALTMN